MEQVNALIRQGKQEAAIRQQLTDEGWSKEDINGAFAIHAISLKPIGSNVMDRWEDEKRKKKEGRGITALRVALYLVLVVVLLAWGNYHGYTLPWFETGAFKSTLDSYMSMFVSSLP